MCLSAIDNDKLANERARISALIVKITFVSLNVRGESHSKKLTFCLRQQQINNHQSLVPARYPEEIRLDRHFKTVLTARLCSCDVIPADSKMAGRKNLQLTW